MKEEKGNTKTKNNTNIKALGAVTSFMLLSNITKTEKGKSESKRVIL